MTITQETIALIVSLVAIATSVLNWIYQLWALRQKEKELKHRMEMDRKEFDEKYATRQEVMDRWLQKLPSLPEPAYRPTLGLNHQPYQYVGPIRNPELFYGCQQELETLTQCLTGPQLSSVSIIGTRKSGKTSFLFHLQRILGSADHPGLVPVYIDAQNPMTSDKRFYAYLLREASAALEARFQSNNPLPGTAAEVEFEELTMFLEKASKKQLRFIFLLDEFERLANDPKIANEDFFGSLRSLVARGHVAWVIASLRKIHMPDTMTSPFHNIIQETIWLGPFSMQEARELIATPALTSGHPFDEADIQTIIQLAGRMPCLMQKASLMLYKLQRAGLTGEAARSRVAEEFAQEAPAEFEDQLAMLSYEEKQTLFELALRKEVHHSAQRLKQIEKYGFIEKRTGGYQILGHAFNEYLSQKAQAIGLD